MAGFDREVFGAAMREREVELTAFLNAMRNPDRVLSPGGRRIEPGGDTVLRGLTTVAYAADDLAAAAKWYGELLGTEPYFRRREYVEFRIGDYQHELGILDRRLMAQLGGQQSAPAGPAGAIVYWHVDDVPATLDRLLSMGATLHQPPRDFGEGFVGASVVDPFGNILGVMRNPHYLDVLGRIPPFELPEIKPVVIPDPG